MRGIDDDDRAVGVDRDGDRRGLAGQAVTFRGTKSPQRAKRALKRTTSPAARSAT